MGSEYYPEDVPYFPTEVEHRASSPTNTWVRWVGIMVLLGVFLYACLVAYSECFPRPSRVDDDLRTYATYAHRVMTKVNEHD